MPKARAHAPAKMSLVNRTLTVHATSDAAAFESKIAPLVDAAPVMTSVVATNLQRALRDPNAFSDPCWLWVKDEDGTTVAASIHTPPRAPHVASDDPEVGVVLADHLAASGRPVAGVGGFRPAAEAFARRWVELRACGLTTTMEQGVYEATDVTPPRGVPGTLRVAVPADAPLLNEWAVGFIEHIPEAVPAGEAMLTDRIERGEMWVWEYDGVPVSMTYASPPSGGVSRISWVYTPPELRRHGYASAVVAGATAEQLAAGNRCMLYTDLANPTSNGIYQAIGYRRVGDGVMLAFEPHS